MKIHRLAPLLLLVAAPPCPAGDWPTFGYDARRSGWARSEVILNRENVGGLVLKWKTTVENEPKSLAALTAPIVVTDVRTGGERRARKDLVYVAGTGDVFYAIDAANGEIFWEKQFKTDVVNKVPGMWLCPQRTQRHADCRCLQEHHIRRLDRRASLCP